MLEDSVKEKEEDFQYLCDSFETHLFSIAEKEKKEEERREEEGGNVEEERKGEEANIEERQNEQDIHDDQEVIKLRNTFLTSHKHWTSLTAGVRSFPKEVKPWEDLVSAYSNLSDYIADLKRRTERQEEELNGLHEKTNPASIVERFSVSSYILLLYGVTNLVSMCIA